MQQLEVQPSEMKALHSALDWALTKDQSNNVEMLTLNLETLPERLRERSEEVIEISTGAFWGFWKNITRKEILWTFSRAEAIKLRAWLERELDKEYQETILVSRQWLGTIGYI